MSDDRKEMTEEQKHGALIVVDGFSQFLMKMHTHAQEKYAEAEKSGNTQEKNIHEGVMVASEIMSKFVIDSVDTLKLGNDTPEGTSPEN